MVEENEGLLLDMTEEELDKAGSKWITIPAGKTQVSRKVEVGPDTGWDNPAKPSIKFAVEVIEEGVDLGKGAKISTGLKKESIGILKQYLAALIDPASGKVGVDHKPFFTKKEMGDGSEKMAFDINKFVTAVVGKQTYGIWKQTKGVKGGIVGGEETVYPKLVAFSPTPIETESLGI